MGALRLGCRSGRTCGEDALGDVEGLDTLERVRATRLVVARDLGGGDGHLELALCEAVQLLEEEVEDVESIPACRVLSYEARATVEEWTYCI